jgi:hypothetical protein
VIPCIAAAALFVAAGPAAAKTYCVPSSVAGCTSSTSSLQQAMTEAASDSSPDTIKIATGTYDNNGCPTGGLTFNSSNQVTIEGAGIGKTIITCDADYNNSLHYYPIISLDGPATLTGVTIQLPAGDSDRGLSLRTGTATGIALTSASSATNVIGAVIDGGTLENSTVSVPTADDGSEGISSFDGAVLNGLTVTAGGQAIGASSPTTISHSTVSGQEVITADGQDGGKVTVYDSVLEITPGGEWALSTRNSNSGVGLLSIAARNVTIVGGGTGSIGVDAESIESGTTSAISLTDSVISGPATPIVRFATAGTTATATVSYSDYPAGSYAGTGAGSTSQTNDLHVSPGFLSPSTANYELAAGSSLIDAGTPGGLSAGEPSTDLIGNPRILAGNGSCSGRRDLGAYEYAPTKLPAGAAAVPTSVFTGSPVKFSATGCSIDPSLAVTFSWSFDDGTTATGVTVTHAFATAGVHHATVVVRDSAGRTGTATATVDIDVAPSPVLSKLALSHKRFTPAAGATITYTDTLTATTDFTLETGGVVSAGRCVAPPKHHHGKLKHCVRVLKRFGHTDHAGANSLHLKTHGLSAGGYVLSAVAHAPGGGSSRTLTVAFTLVRPKPRHRH